MAGEVDGRMVLAVDGSASSLGAARWGALTARLREMPVTIVTAVELPVPRTDSASLPTEAMALLRSKAERALDAALSQVREVLGPDHPVDRRLWEGPPIPQLLAHSDRAAMLVLGVRGLGDAPESIAGSVASAVAAHARCPVAVIHGWSGTETGLGSGPVVVGVDGSDECTPAVRLALVEAAARGVDVRAIHAGSDVPVAGEDGPTADGARTLLDRALDPWCAAHPEVTVHREVVRDRPVRHLIQAAQDAQLLVVGNRGRGGFDGMMAGSTSRALLHTAPCPLVIAHR